MIELNVTNLVGGNIVITTSQSGGNEGGETPTGNSKTVFTLVGGTTEEYDIEGTLDANWLQSNGFWDEGTWFKYITEVDIGNTVTSIDSYVFGFCGYLTSVTFEGKDRATVQGMENYPFGLDYCYSDSGVTIHCSDGNISVPMNEN